MPRQTRRLAPYKTQLRALANRKVSQKRKDLSDPERRSPSTVCFTGRFGRARKFVLGMRHSKKMVPVSEEALQRHEQRQRLETSPLMGTMMHKERKSQTFVNKTM